MVAADITHAFIMSFESNMQCWVMYDVLCFARFALTGGLCQIFEFVRGCCLFGLCFRFEFVFFKLVVVYIAKNRFVNVFIK